jgi:hypothetical protein
LVEGRRGLWGGGEEKTDSGGDRGVGRQEREEEKRKETGVRRDELEPAGGWQ